MLAVAAAVSDLPASTPPRECGGHTPFSSFPFPTLWRHGYTLVGGEKLELDVSSIIFCFVLALSTAYLFCIGLFRMYVLANSRQ